MQSGFFTQLGVALEGNFDDEVGKGLARTESALYRATDEYGDEIQSKWRADVLGSSLGNSTGLSKTIRRRAYPNKGLNPAVLVYSTFPVIQRAFEQATVIQGREGRFLAIPNPEVWPNGRAARPTRGGRGVSVITMAERRFGPLRFVYRQGEASLLVADVQAGGGARKLTAAARAQSLGGRREPSDTIIVFFLVKQARLPRLLRGAEIRRRAERDAPGRMQQLFVKHFEADQGTRLITHPGDTE